MSGKSGRIITPYSVLRYYRCDDVGTGTYFHHPSCWITNWRPRRLFANPCGRCSRTLADDAADSLTKRGGWAGTWDRAADIIVVGCTVRNYPLQAGP